MGLPVGTTPLPEITLAELPALSAQLAMKVRSAGFVPDVILYVERGARLLAWELCCTFGCGAIAVTARRRGARWKELVAPAARFVPRRLRDTIRRFDERWFWSHGSGHPRPVISAFSGPLKDRRILVVDDAADSGRTIRGCCAWLSTRGVYPTQTMVAVLAATTPAGRAAADVWIFERNCRLPWSSDSTERTLAEEAFRRNHPPTYAPRDL